MSGPLKRRPLLLAVAGGAAAVGTIGATARTGLLSGDDRPPGTGALLELSSGRMGVQTLDLPLGGDALVRTGPAEWRSARLDTTTFSMIGLTWRRGQVEPQVDVSARVGGVWQGWQPLPHAHEAPDPAEATATVGTDLTWTGRAEGIKLRVRGSRPAGLTLVLLHPTALPGDTATSPRPARSNARAGTVDGSVPRPVLRTRRDWGADPSWRDGKPSYNRAIQQVHVHHTVNSNDYSRADVPALIRGMYRYHTASLGWSDIGYNFLVDRFGRIWVGRAGGAWRPVRGAHTLGFNATSAGVSVIGNHDTAAPTSATLAAIARIAAWKLDRYGRDPEGQVTVSSEGSDKYPAGRRVTLPVIDGHRDTNDTACPGRYLYAELPWIRRRTERRIASFTGAR
jgi:hypothetical protein